MLQLSHEIEKRIDQMRKIREVLRKLGEECAQKTGDYEKAMAKTIIELKNGVRKVDEELGSIENPPVTIIEKIARGFCYAEKIEMEKAQALYKNGQLNLKTLVSELSGLQSLFKQQEEI